LAESLKITSNPPGATVELVTMASHFVDGPPTPEESPVAPTPVSGTASSSPVSASAATSFGVLTITSDPDAAEIYIDGKFHGNAPATLKLTAGSHTVVLKSSGLADYTRALEVPASSKLSLKASLETNREP
jgi:PEGA domain